MKGCLCALVAVLVCTSALSLLVKMQEWRRTPEQQQAEVLKLQAKRDAEEDQQREKNSMEAERNAQRAEMQREENKRVAATRHEFLEDLVKIEGIEYAEIKGGGDLLIVRFAPLIHIGQDHARVMCEGIAYKWAATAGLSFVRCESWYGNKIYAAGDYSGPVPKEHLALVLNATLKQMAEEKAAAAPTATMKMSPQEQAYRDSAAMVAMEGKTLAEIEGTHGKALSKSAATGWAEFRTFRARFENGKVAEVSVK